MTKRFRGFVTLLSLLLVSTIFSACSQKSYDASINCQDLSTALKREISVPQGYFEEYTDDEVKYLFSSPKLYDDICIVYSADSTDVCEVGILHAASDDNAKLLYEDAKAYIKALQEQKSDFLSNYSPAELSKLNSAEVRRYGNYIIFTVAESGDKEELFKKAEMILSE